MNAEVLLAHYERIAETPDAIMRLRRFVLNLAVRGKLVPQSASESRVPLASHSAEQTPSELPASWQYAPLGALLREDTRNGFSRRPDEANHGVPILRISAGTMRRDGLVAEEEHKLISGIDERTRREYGLEAGDLLACRFNGNKAFVGRLTLFTDYLGLRPIYPDKLIRVRVNPNIALPEFLRAAGESDLVRGEVEAHCATTVGNWGISASNLKEVRFPVPPLAEQRRIVAKVNELMSLCDRLEAARTAREATRDRLAAASLARLNTPDPETFPSDARFAIAALPALTTRPDQIKQLRQTILNLAVCGKLVPQDAADGPAPAFDRVTLEGSALPFVLPTSWCWSRLSALGQLKGGGTPSKTRDDFWNGDIPWVSPKDMKVSYIEAAQLSITAAAIDDSAVNLLPSGAVLFVVRGMILAHSFPVALTRVPVTVNQDMKALVLKNPDMAEYLLRALKGLKPQMLAKVQRSTHGTCRLEGADYSDFPIPIPPLAEQRRIVAKVDELMALCDALEASLTAAQDTRARLLQATLQAALDTSGTQHDLAA